MTISGKRKLPGPTGSEGRRQRRPQKLSNFEQQLWREWQKLHLPAANATAIVAVSGGADSVALLLGVVELVKSKKFSIKIVIAHLNHKLRGKPGNADARFVSSLAKDLGCPAVIKAVDVRAKASSSKDNLEQAARRARYEFLRKTAHSNQAAIILTAHTLDDQVETVLLNLLRGSGTRGLSGIEAIRPIHDGAEVLLVRPLLSWARRSDTEGFCRQHSIGIRLDEMNADQKYARVRVRKELIPLMKSFNPRFVEGLARTADILREDDIALEGAAARLVELSRNGQTRGKKEPALRTDLLRLAPPALRRRALRQWLASCRGDLRRLEHVHIVALEKFLFNIKSGRVIELPGRAKIVRSRGLFSFIAGPD
jgi:tRNA(Ile)-lysidine synthase